MPEILTVTETWLPQNVADMSVEGAMVWMAKS